MALIKLNNRGVRNVSTFGSVAGGSMVFIKKLTASSSGTLDFVDGTSDVVLDDTYKEYLFTFKNMHPATDNAKFQVNFSIDSGSNYNVTKTTTFFRGVHYEDGSGGGLSYSTGQDLAQSTDFANIVDGVGSDADQNVSGHLHLFDPSNTTFVKHFISNANTCTDDNATKNVYDAGYANTTSAIDAIQFKMSSGNIDAGDICLYGIN